MTLADQARQLQQYGRHGDTLLAHISPEEALILRAFGGAGTQNPATGLPEFFAPSPGGIGAGGEHGIGSESFGGGGDDEETGLQAISNEVDQLGGVGSGETAKGFSRSRFGGMEAYGQTGLLAELTGMSPQEMAAALSASRGSRPSQAGIGASLGQNLAGIGVTPSAAMTAASISGPGFGSESEQVTSISDVGQASRAAGMVDPGLVGRLSGAARGITPQSVGRAARALQGMRATPGGTAPMVGNLNVREDVLGVPVGIADIPNPGQVGRSAGGYAAQIAAGIQSAMAQAMAPGQGMARATGYQGAAPGPGLPSGRPSPSGAFAQPSQIASLSAPAPGPAAQPARASAPRAGPFGADRGELVQPMQPRLAPPSLMPQRAAPARAGAAAFAPQPRPAFTPPRGTYGPYDPALRRLLGLQGSTSLAFG